MPCRLDSSQAECGSCCACVSVSVQQDVSSFLFFFFLTSPCCCCQQQQNENPLDEKRVYYSTVFNATMLSPCTYATWTRNMKRIFLDDTIDSTRSSSSPFPPPSSWFPTAPAGHYSLSTFDSTPPTRQAFGRGEISKSSVHNASSVATNLHRTGKSMLFHQLEKEKWILKWGLIFILDLWATVVVGSSRFLSLFPL